MTDKGVKHSTNCGFGYSTLFFIAATNLFLSFKGLRIIGFFLTGFNSFLAGVNVFFQQIMAFCCVHGFSLMSPFFKAILALLLLLSFHCQMVFVNSRIDFSI